MLDCSRHLRLHSHCFITLGLFQNRLISNIWDKRWEGSLSVELTQCWVLKLLSKFCKFYKFRVRVNCEYTLHCANHSHPRSETRHGWFMNIFSESHQIVNLLLKRSKRTTMVFSWFSSSAEAASGPETERGGYECAPYTILESHETYQVRYQIGSSGPEWSIWALSHRTYPQSKWATVIYEKPGSGPGNNDLPMSRGWNQQPQNTSFRKLFRYITGENIFSWILSQFNFEMNDCFCQSRS